MNKHQKGFTLIELLVVIAIIGILAALVLVALGNARTKAHDARIKSNVSQLRTLAEVHYDANSVSYSGFGDCVGNDANGISEADCAGDIAASVSAIQDDTGSLVAVSDDQTFCISAPLSSAPDEYVCTDQSGRFNHNDSAPCSATKTQCEN